MRTHHACQDWFLAADETDLLIPSPLVSEACYVIWRRCGSDVEAAFLSDLAEGSYGQVSQVESGDLRRMSELVTTYTNLPLGGADACVIAMAERLKITKIATMDRRHFSIVRPNHADAFTLLP